MEARHCTQNPWISQRKPLESFALRANGLLTLRTASGQKTLCGSGLTRDAGGAVCQVNRGDPIASKPAPTLSVRVRLSPTPPAGRASRQTRRGSFA